MLPKRKFIKKQFVAQETSAAEEQARFSSQNLLEKLQSIDPKQKLDALSAIANLQSLPSEIQQQLLSATALTQMLNILSVGGDLSLVQTTLFAIHNICILDTQNNNSMRIVDQLFSLGLDKALMSLDSSNTNIIKPILVLMTDIAIFVPKKYKYLLTGMQATLVTQFQKYLTQEGYYDLVIQFLMRSNYTMQFKEAMNPQQIAFVNIIRKISEMDKNYKNRAVASRLLVSMSQGKSKQLVEIFFSTFEEFISDMNLQKQYQINFKEKDNNEAEDEEQDEDQMDQCMKEQNKKFNKNVQIDDPNYKIFLDAIEGIQMMLQFLVEKLEDEENFNDQEGDDEQQEMSDEENQIEEFNSEFYKQFFFSYFSHSLTRVFTQLQKFTELSFLEGQNLIELLLRLILLLPKPMVGLKNDKGSIPIELLIMMVQKIIVHEFKQQLETPYRIPEPVLIFNIKTAFQIIIRYKTINNRSIYIEIPALKYNSSQQTVMKINKKWKQCWINLLQIYSMFFNPEKFAAVTDLQNKSIGALLKKLIVEIPEVELQEWRAQTIDTLFDVYSNENFDKFFMEFGFVDILTQVLKIGGGKGKGKSGKKSSKFISAVVADIQRFIGYKKKMIGF